MDLFVGNVQRCGQEWCAHVQPDAHDKIILSGLCAAHNVNALWGVPWTSTRTGQIKGQLCTFAPSER